MSISKGLDGIIAAQSSISSIVGTTLSYRGYNIDDLTDNSSYEEVVFLLLNGKLPNKKELSFFEDELKVLGKLSNEIIDIMKACPKNSDYMPTLRTVISALSLYDKKMNDFTDEANLLKSKYLLAQMASIVAGLYRIRNNQEPIDPDSNLDFSANFLYMLSGKIPQDIFVEALNKSMVLHADHELNASTFALRVTVATLSDMYSGLVSALGTLKGPLHGGANEQVMVMLEEIGDIDKVEEYLDVKFKNKEKIMGMGHRVYKQGDPRAKYLKTMSKQLAELNGETKWYDMSTKIEEIVYNNKGLVPNVDFYSASVYTYLGIPKELFTCVFAMSRTAGWMAHNMEQYQSNKLIRPRSEYIGKINQIYIPLEER